MPVTYQVVQIPGLAPGEVGYKLSDGSYAAVSFAPGEHAAPHVFSIKATARAVHADGVSVTDYRGAPIVCHKHASAPKAALVSGATTGTAIRAEALAAVIHDPDGLIAELAASKHYGVALGSSYLPVTDTDTCYSLVEKLHAKMEVFLP